ncbi:uncharacterized protein N7515_001734 [Penicillium bovifimosum]|uniref:F-box domain-containing protein n=1 Tax=Penicillium bovifimosum TaxID=126998 RepID=A0A9W9HA87_9EURO|nr:uncharacterized protein N7515_001734 [Penicillium bovifimosum]KAJ5142947.1 hypothetical protein N7515_001734 [Penicillium bovifimosum]
MVNLQDLPLELLQGILSFIANNNDIDIDEEFFSREFRDLAQPLLFRNFTDDVNTDRNKTIRFTKAIYERPGLGEHVRHVTIKPLPIKYTGKGIAKEHIKFYEGIIKDLQLGDMEKEWLISMRNDGVNGLGLLIALLVTKTPNLRHLHMPDGQSRDRPFLYFFSRHPSFLSNLTSVSIEGDYKDTAVIIPDHEQLLSLPKLKSVVIESGHLDHSFPSSWTTGTLSADEFSFQGCHFVPEALKKFMRACKSLKSFTYTKFDVIPSQRPFGDLLETHPEFNAAQATEEALQHKDTLEVFSVELATDREGYVDVKNYNSTRVNYGSFADFSVLKKICVSHAYLPAHPQLPATLEKLHISSCHSSTWEMARNISTDCKKGLYPQLTEVKVSALDTTAPFKLPWHEIPEGHTPEQCLLSLQDMFKGTKVEFDILPYKLPPPWDEDEEDTEDEVLDFDIYDGDDFGYDNDYNDYDYGDNYDNHFPLGL